MNQAQEKIRLEQFLQKCLYRIRAWNMITANIYLILKKLCVRCELLVRF